MQLLQAISHFSGPFLLRIRPTPNLSYAILTFKASAKAAAATDPNALKASVRLLRV